MANNQAPEINLYEEEVSNMDDDPQTELTPQVVVPKNQNMDLSTSSVEGNVEEEQQSKECFLCHKLTEEHASTVSKGIETLLENSRITGRLDLVEYVKLWWWKVNF